MKCIFISTPEKNKVILHASSVNSRGTSCVHRSRRFAQGARTLSRIPPLFFIFAPQPVRLTVSSLRSVFPPRGLCASAAAASESPATRCRCRLSQAEESPATCCCCHHLSRGRPCHHRSRRSRVVPFRRSAATCLLSQQITPPLTSSDPQQHASPRSASSTYSAHRRLASSPIHGRAWVCRGPMSSVRSTPSSPLRPSIFGNRTETPSSPNLPPTRLLASPRPSAPPPSPTSRTPAGSTPSRTSATRR
jgi:hypothetical protein